MSILKKLVSEITNLSDANSVLSELTTKNIKQIVYSGPQSIAAVEKAYGSVFTITLIQGMKLILEQLISSGDVIQANYLEIYFDRFKYGVGLDFSDDDVRSKLDSLAPYFGQDVVDKLKALGVNYKSKWEINTDAAEPTLEQVEEALNGEITERNRVIWISYVKDGILSNNGNGKSINELKALIAERE